MRRNGFVEASFALTSHATPPLSHGIMIAEPVPSHRRRSVFAPFANRRVFHVQKSVLLLRSRTPNFPYYYHDVRFPASRFGTRFSPSWNRAGRAVSQSGEFSSANHDRRRNGLFKFSNSRRRPRRHSNDMQRKTLARSGSECQNESCSHSDYNVRK